MMKSGAALFVMLVFLAGCVSSTTNIADPGVAAEVSRLKQLGFRHVTQTDTGTQILRYSGPINRSVECRRGSGGYAPIQARSQTNAGGFQTVKLDAYLRISPASGRNQVRRNGIYIVTIRERDGGETKLSGATFSPRGQGRLPGGLRCRAA
ncbi:hypothetical protein [Roseibium sp. MMSF_3544]|uniref:hypothetical protein n=1 Tax=unclassified Roseibium TaxID=2629323 RepID=UPI00273E86B1|nr:hypothetical protein [Roseibium sp. MMSF_3544]